MLDSGVVLIVIGSLPHGGEVIFSPVPPEATEMVIVTVSELEMCCGAEWGV